MAFRFLRRGRPGEASRLAKAALASGAVLGLGLGSFTRLEPVASTVPENATEKGTYVLPPTPITLGEKNDYIAVFLGKKSSATLQERFQLKHEKVPTAPHVTLRFAPTEEEAAEFDKMMGQPVKVMVKGYAEDDSGQAVLVVLENDKGEVMEVTAPFPHITLSASDEDGIEYSYSNILMERIQQTSKIPLSDIGEGGTLEKKEWKGVLPQFQAFPESRAEFRMLDQPVALSGTLCTAQRYDQDEGVCMNDESTECGFCIFMRGGPCANAFRRWEKCLSRCKDNDEEFVEKCGPQTLVLKDCCDRNPGYYSIISGDGDGDDSDNKEKSENDDQNQTSAETKADKDSNIKTDSGAD